ncbi:azurin [Balneola sp. EhC07]|jgi:azurin|uniref:azurin n=1 Tax=Balneola sp. EhC07 TaxID=1849360 RepID=UPI0007F36B7C|nr:azurin [Balneola sp. EhC07]OAN59675.1 azurin [Balneola sp. EhC07]
MNIIILFLSAFLSFSTATNPATNVATEITVEANDRMQFDTKEISVKAGEKITLTLKHVGKLPKQAMGHNWVLLKEGVVVKDFAMEAMKAKDNDYLPKDSKDIIVATELLGGGETDTITFEAPAKGTYTFICTFPGHYGIMQGTFVVS